MSPTHSFSPAEINWSGIVTRVKELLITPDLAWSKIKNETLTIKEIYQNYAGILATIGAICTLIGMTVVGVSTPVATIRFPVFSTLVTQSILLALQLGGLYVGAVVLQWLAPKFNGTVDLLSAFKIMAYGMTPTYIGSFFSLIPILGVIGLLLHLYSLYVIYRGVAHLTTVPQVNRVIYFMVFTGCMITIGVLAVILLSAFSIL